MLSRWGEDAKVIAGGQSLVPALNMRLLAPRVLIDIGRLEELRGISVEDGVLRIGALTRHAEVQRSPDIVRHAPLLARAVGHVAHAAIRNRGTFGGSLANADPAAELPACIVALKARLSIVGPGGSRAVDAEEFFLGPFETALRPDEILVRAEIDACEPGYRSAFAELARRTGDYALLGLAAHARVAEDRLEDDLRLVFFAVGRKPTAAGRAAAALVGGSVGPEALAAAEEALASDLEPHDDLQISAATRLRLARVLLRQVVSELLQSRGESRSVAS